MIAPIYDWSGFYIGANGGWGSSHKCWDLTTAAGVAHRPAKAATMRPAASPAARSAIAGSPAPGCSASKRQGNWADLKGSNVSACSRRRSPTSRKIDAFGLFTGQVGYAANNVLFYVKGGAAVTDDHFRVIFTPGSRAQLPTASTTPVGAARSAPASNSASPRTGRPAIEYDHLFMQASHRRPSATLPAGAAVFGTDRIRQDVDLVTVRVNYRWGGPVVAQVLSFAALNSNGI